MSSLIFPKNNSWTHSCFYVIPVSVTLPRITGAHLFTWKMSGIAGIVFRGVNLSNTQLKETQVSIHVFNKYFSSTKKGEMLEYKDEFQWQQSFKGFKNTLHTVVAKILNATMRYLAYNTQLFNSECCDLIVCSSCTSLNTLIKTICLRTGFQFL